MKEFVWTVCLDGYRLLDGARAPLGQRKPAAIGPNGDLGCRRVRFYTPLSHNSGLHRTFARLKPDPSAVITFANRFGLLGVRSAKHSPALDNSLVGTGSGIEVEPFSDWEAESEKLRRALELWDTTIIGNCEMFPRGHDGNASCALTGPEPCSCADTKDAREALDALLTDVNQQLETLDVESGLVWDASGAGIKMALVPHNLLGAIWADFALAVGANKHFDRYKLCPACGIYFEKHLLKRKDAIYCSDACKSRAYRNRSVK